MASGDRRDEAQQRDELLADIASEALNQRDRQSPLINRWHERGTGDAPERRCRECVAPPQPPARDRPAINAGDLGKPLHA